MKDQIGGIRSAPASRHYANPASDLLRFAFWLSRDALWRRRGPETMAACVEGAGLASGRGRGQALVSGHHRREYARSFERKRFVNRGCRRIGRPGRTDAGRREEQNLAEMRAALFKLPDEYREPLVLQVLMGFSTRNSTRARSLVRRVLTRLFRARKQLRVLCGEDTSMDPQE